jgi:hypothetical protein
MFRPPGPSSGCTEDFKLNHTLVVALADFGVGEGRVGRREVGEGDEISSVMSYIQGVQLKSGPLTKP